MSNKNFREFSNKWENEVCTSLQRKNQISNFCYLCEEIYKNLTLIKKYDKTKFNNISSISIDDYIEVFNNLYKNFYNEICNVKYEGKDKNIKKYGKFFDVDYEFWDNFKRFVIPDDDLNLNKFTFNEKPIVIDGSTYHNHYIFGIKDEYYKQIKSKVNQILILERELKFLTMKENFWQGVAKTSKDINLNGDFVICGKLLYEGGWRTSAKDQNVLEFGKNKIYQSTSIISNKTTNRVFCANNNDYTIPKKAFLVYKFDLEKICCVSYRDAYSDEFIDGKTDFEEISIHTDIQKIDEDISNNKKHELFAFSSTFSTLNSVLNANSIYNELVLKNPEPIAVVALNKTSEDYAKKLAQELQVDYLGTMPHNANKQTETDAKKL
ncbi:MAG: hypothetical protein ACI4TZ_01020 [Christensenellales bacterium]